MKLLIAIPALNEEDSIASTVERCLVARERILRESPVTAVDVTVVSDGSTDRTVELAQGFGDEINLIVFEENQGYGAAIKAAWSESDADLLGVVDADGTCDPNVFAALCARAIADDADVVLGCRLNRASRMPLLRRVGNVLFALMLSFFSSQRVRDTSSGMRVVRRASLPKLMPLPDGMHFTPAMSARAILSDDLKIVEVDMPYHERAGTSKLRVVKDGFRFLKVIVEAAFLYRPSRPLSVAGIACAVVAVALIAGPTHYYLQHRAVLEWMIYRFVVSSLAASSAALLLTAAYLTDKIVTIVLSNRPEVPRTLGWLAALRMGPLFWLVPAAMLIVGGALVVPSFIQLVRTGATYEHWSRFIAMSCLFSCALILIVARVFDYTLDLLAERVAYLRANQDAEDGHAVWHLLFGRPQRTDEPVRRSSGFSA
jgi:glycosyltransferase involved in cell wall biosynthesis